MNGFFSKIFTVFSLQIFILLVSLPVLVAWGLPFVGLAVVGNLLFIPFIMLFLFLSIIFFIVLPIPGFSFLLGRAIELLVFVWNMALQIPQRFLYRAIPFYGYFPFALLFCCVLLLLHFKIHRRVRFFVFTGFCLFLFFSSFFSSLFIQGKRFYVACGSEQLCCFISRDGTCLIDHGGRRRTGALSRWAQYRLPAFLAQNLGTTCIDTYKTTKLTQSVCQTIFALAEEGMVGAVCVCNSEKQDQRLIGQLQVALPKSGVAIVLR